MPSKKGDPKPPDSGRRKGQPNKVTFEVKEWCRSVLESRAYREAAAQRIINGDAPQLERLAYLYAYAGQLRNPGSAASLWSPCGLSSVGVTSPTGAGRLAPTSVRRLVLGDGRP